MGHCVTRCKMVFLFKPNPNGEVFRVGIQGKGQLREVKLHELWSTIAELMGSTFSRKVLQVEVETPEAVSAILYPVSLSTKIRLTPPL